MLSTKPFQSSPPISQRDPSASRVTITMMIQVAMAWPEVRPPSRPDGGETLPIPRARNGSTIENPQSVSVSAKAVA